MASMRRKIVKPIGVFPYASAGVSTVQIDRDGILSQLNIAVDFTITNTGVSPVTPLNFALAQIIQELQVTLNGKDTVIRQSGEHLAARAITDFGALPFGLDATVVLTALAATTYRVNIPVALFLPNAQRPDDTGIECRNFSQVTVALRFANANCQEIFTTPNGALISNVSCSVFGTYTQTPESEIVPLDSNASLVRVLDYVLQNNTTTNANLGIQMDRGNQLYRTFKLITKRNGVAVDNIISNLRVQAGQFVYVDESANNNRANIVNNYRLFSPSAIAAITGTYDHNFAQYGSLMTGINVSPEALKVDLFHYLNTTYTSGTETITILREAVRKPSV